MNKRYSLLFMFTNLLIAQVTMGDINRLSNEQLDLIRDELKSSSNPSNVDIINPEEVKLEASQEQKSSEYFGYNYFKNDINFFDNIPTPADFKLGPGDEIILSLWGETNLRENFIINKEGLIYYQNIGFLNLSNKTLDEAELLLIEELSNIYSTLKNKESPTTLMLELGALKSVNVYFTGEIKNPGISLIHPFSDVFSAIVQAGGINESGSLRNIQLIRNNQIINSIDFYNFFINGENNFSNIKIIDGDIIHIPYFFNRVKIEGEIMKPSKYELLNNESLASLVGYAGGFTSSASSTVIIDQIIPLDKRKSDDNAMESINANYLKNEDSRLILNNGDNVNVLKIGNVDSKVEIFGRVKNPGKYASDNTLRDILDIAGGFDDPLFRTTIKEDEILLLRKDSNQFYGKEILSSYKDSENIKLAVGDKIFIYEDVNYENSFTYRVEGQVNKPGTYAFKEGISLDIAIALAGGLTPFSRIENISVKKEYTQIDEEGNLTISENDVGNISGDYQISENSVITALPFENVVNVQGNVYNPGLIAYEPGMTMKNAIILAGGYKPYSIKKRVYLENSNGKIKKATLFRGRAKRVNPGDVVFVPIDPDPKEFDLTGFTSQMLGILTNIVAIAAIVDSNSK